ncbi:MAG: low-complexity tail membrane protein [Synechococcales bacterium]|nr:low-complexity tail membrane protein [Synechococcales bacterium]
MRSFWFDPYLWIHLAGAAAVPIWLEVCFLGLALGNPLLPPGLEILLVAAIGVTPVLWMQWQRPFYIFSLLVVALKVDALTPNQRRLLRFFKSFQTKLLSLVVPIVLTYLLWLLYQFTPLATDALATLPVPQWHLLGLLVAAIAFLLANLFLQVPVSVLRVLFASEQAVTQAEPYPLEQIGQNFTSIGFEVAQILPPLSIQPPPSRATAPAAADLEKGKADLDEGIANEEETITDVSSLEDVSTGSDTNGMQPGLAEAPPETDAVESDAADWDDEADWAQEPVDPQSADAATASEAVQSESAPEAPPPEEAAVKESISNEPTAAESSPSVPQPDEPVPDNDPNRVD